MEVFEDEIKEGDSAQQVKQLFNNDNWKGVFRKCLQLTIHETFRSLDEAEDKIAAAITQATAAEVEGATTPTTAETAAEVEGATPPAAAEAPTAPTAAAAAAAAAAEAPTAAATAAPTAPTAATAAAAAAPTAVTIVNPLRGTKRANRKL
jgi:hypothetical protein